MVYNYDFGDWLQAELNKRGWNQSDLARASHKGRAIINKIVNKTTVPTTETLIALSRGLGLPPETIFRASGLFPPPATNEPLNLAEWIQIFLKADDATREDLLEYAYFKTEQSQKRKRAYRPSDVD